MIKFLSEDPKDRVIERPITSPEHFYSSDSPRYLLKTGLEQGSAWQVKKALDGGANPNEVEAVDALFMLTRVKDHGHREGVNDILGMMLDAGFDPNVKFVGPSPILFYTGTFFNLVCAEHDNKHAVMILDRSKVAIDPNELLPKGDRRGTLLESFLELDPNSLDALQRHFERLILPARPDLALNHLWTSIGEDEEMVHMAFASYPANLRWAMEHPDLGVKALIEEKDVDGRSVLRIAVDDISTDNVRYLLSLGASVDSEDNSRRSVIHAARLAIDDPDTAGSVVEKTAIHELLVAARDARLAASKIDELIDQHAGVDGVARRSTHAAPKGSP